MYHVGLKICLLAKARVILSLPFTQLYSSYRWLFLTNYCLKVYQDLIQWQRRLIITTLWHLHQKTLLGLDGHSAPMGQHQLHLTVGTFLNHYLCPPQVGKGPLWASYSQALVDHLLPKSNDTAMTSELTQVCIFSDMTQITIGYFSLSQISSYSYRLGYVVYLVNYGNGPIWPPRISLKFVSTEVPHPGTCPENLLQHITIGHDLPVVDFVLEGPLWLWLCDCHNLWLWHSGLYKLCNHNYLLI